MDETYWLWMGDAGGVEFSLAQIESMGREHEITRETLFWSMTQEEWQPLFRLPEEWDRAASRDRLAELKAMGFEWVEYVDSGRGDDCEACHALDRRRFRISEAPALPPEGCTCLWSRVTQIAARGPE